jgi:serine/threonine-protein kinase
MFADGDTFGPYTIVRRLGAGAMGEVYQARHRHMGREAAIKVLRAELTEDSEVVNRFFTEARATAAVRHPGIVEIFDCDLHRSGRAFIVMEFLAGEDLAHRLQNVRSFAGDWPGLRAIARQIAGALGAAHAAGIVHRDLKPGNIFLVGVGADPPAVKVVDFGIAKLLNRGGGDHSLTQTGHILGTPLYMSPEQAKGAKTIDHRTDIYALGCVLFEMITGQPPFVRRGPADVLVAHLHDPAPRASSLEATVPAGLDDLVAEMLAKNPDQRPRSMADVVARLAEPAAPAPGRVATQLMTGGKPAAPAPAGASPAPVGQNAPVSAAPGTTAGRPAAKDGSAAAVLGASAAAAATRAGFAGRDAQVLGRSGDTTLGSSAAELAAVEGDEAPARSSSRRTGLFIALAGVAVLIGGGAVLFGRSGDRRAGGSSAASPAPAPAVLPAPAPAVPPPAPEPARIAFTSQPSGAAVWVGAETAPRGTTPLTLELPAGAPPTQVVLRAEGREPATLTLDGKDRSSRHVVLSPAAAPAPKPTPPRAQHRRRAKEPEFRAIED